MDEYSHQSKLAPIERLPTEITQDIFLQSLNLSFPRASLSISQKLNDLYIYNTVADHAFKFKDPFPRKVPESVVENQTQLFSMRWMTWDFFTQYLSRHVKSKSCGCPIGIKCHDKAGCGGQDSSENQASKYSYNEIYLPGIPDIRCSLPTKLTRGPFTDDKISFLLCLLRISKMSVDWANKDAVRIASLGKREAIMERNLDAVHMFSRVRRLGKAPNLKLVKFAVMEAGCDRSIVLNLMTAAKEWGHRRWNDVELDAWVARQEAKGNPKGKWLRIKLDEVRYGRMPDPTTGDYRGDILEVRKSPFRVSENQGHIRPQHGIVMIELTIRRPCRWSIFE
jgi:hypothetical protein